MNKFLLLYLIVIPTYPASQDAQQQFTQIVIEHPTEASCSRMADLINSTTGRNWSTARLEELRTQRWFMGAPDKLEPHDDFQYAANSKAFIAVCSDVNPKAISDEKQDKESEADPDYVPSEQWSHEIKPDKQFQDRLQEQPLPQKQFQERLPEQPDDVARGKKGDYVGAITSSPHEFDTLTEEPERSGNNLQ